MKILISHASVYKKGGWGRIFPLANGLAKIGNQVTIITTNPLISIFRKTIIINNVNIIVFPEILPSRISRMGFGFFSLILKVIYVLFNKFDIVHSDNGHRPLSGLPCRIHKKVHGSVYIAEWYDWYGKGGEFDHKKKLFKLFLGRYEVKYEIKDKVFADGIVVLSEVLRTRAELFKPPNKIIKIHGGADVFAIPYIRNNKTLKGKYGINKNMVTFGYIDALSVNLKEVQPLIDSIIELNLESKVKLLLFGSINSIEKSLTEKIKNMIINFGWINYEEEFEKLQCVDVFVLFKEDILGNRAGWPNCIGDYLACGRPVFLNPIGEVIEFVSKYPEGFFISSLSSRSISDQLQFIVNNQSLLEEKGRINRVIAENEISWHRKSEELNSFYKRILSE
jgi:glycosyltransferase involved in cell wall biosynthesis